MASSSASSGSSYTRSSIKKKICKLTRRSSSVAHRLEVVQLGDQTFSRNRCPRTECARSGGKPCARPDRSRARRCPPRPVSDRRHRLPRARAEPARRRIRAEGRICPGGVVSLPPKRANSRRASRRRCWSRSRRACT
eukprot:2919126-Pleurochrysis_carterae.AAC.2